MEQNKAEHIDILAELDQVTGNYSRSPESAVLVPASYHHAKRGVKAAFMSRHTENAPLILAAVAKIYSFLDNAANALVFDSETTKIQYQNTIRDREELSYVLKSKGHGDLAELVEREARDMPVLGDMSKAEVLFELSWNKILWGLAQAKERKVQAFYDITDREELREIFSRTHSYVLTNQLRDDVKIAKLLNIKAREVAREVAALQEQVSEREAEDLYSLKPAYQP